MLATMVAVTCLVGVVPARASSSAPFPRSLHAQVWTGQEIRCYDLAPGHVISPALARHGFGPTIGPNYYGPVGWRILQEGRNAPQCPIETTDHGATWHVARWVLAAAWVGGSSYFVSHLMMMSADQVWAWGSSSLDCTINAGRTWYNVFTPERQVALTGLIARSNLEMGMKLVVGSWPDALTSIPRATYRPTNPAFTDWTLVSVNR
jgi:hypothetical protein